MFQHVQDAIDRGVPHDQAIAEEAGAVRRELECLLADDAHLPIRLELSGGSEYEIVDPRAVKFGPTTVTLFDEQGQCRVIIALIHLTAMYAHGMADRSFTVNTNQEDHEHPRR